MGGAEFLSEKRAITRVASDTTRLEAAHHRRVPDHEPRRVSYPSLAHAHLSTAWARHASRSFWGTEMLYALEKQSEADTQERSHEPTLSLEDMYHSTDSIDSVPDEPDKKNKEELQRSPSPESVPDIPKLPTTRTTAYKKSADSSPPELAPRTRSSSLHSRPMTVQLSQASKKATSFSPLQAPRKHSSSLQSKPAILNQSPPDALVKDGSRLGPLRPNSAQRKDGLRRRSHSSPPPHDLATQLPRSPETKKVTESASLLPGSSCKMSSSLESRPVILNWSATTLKSTFVKRASTSRSVHGKPVVSLRKRSSSLEFPNI